MVDVDGQEKSSEAAGAAKAGSKAALKPVNAKSRGSRLKTALIQLAVVTGLIMLAYFFGRMASFRETREKTELAENLGQLVRQQEARRQIDIALRALENRNFGTAQQTLGRSASLLDYPGASEATLALRRELSDYKFLAGEDISDQRRKMIDWIGRFDSLIDETLPPLLPDSANSAAAP